MSVFFTVLTFLFILVSVALVLVILVQRPQGGGLASAFGGGGGTDTAFGGRTGDALTVGTVSVFVVYLILAMALNIFNPQSTLRSAEEAAKTESATQTPSATMAAPTDSPRPLSTLTTPLGKISLISCASFNVVSGVISDGFSTTVLPAAKVGPSFQAAIISG